MRDLHAKLTEIGIRHIWSTGPGGHTWKYWSSVLPLMFTFHLASEQESGSGQPIPAKTGSNLSK
jgi:S-formylglutathione hydrolase FrmB